MNETQDYLKDLLTIDCNLQTNLQHLLIVTSRDALESKSSEIKLGLKEYKEKLNEMKDYCDSFNRNERSSFLSRLNRASNYSKDNGSSSSSLTSNSPKDIFINELQNQKEYLSNIESRFRNAYLAAQVKLDQLERENLLVNESTSLSSSSSVEVKKRNINNQILLKQSNDITSKLNEINRQLKWTENQTSDIIPVLDQSSKGLKNIQQEFGTMRVVINDGKRLLFRLSRREFTDKLLIILCLCFFFSVVFYIIWKRLF
jgi:hypothetical protein